MKITIAVPVYNAMLYLSQTLESIAGQAYPALEVLLIDDGSTDQSTEICRAFSEKDKRFRYIRQANAGLSAARNTGIQHADGDYIWFVDADDMVEQGAARSVAVYLEGLSFLPDILFSNTLLFSSDGKQSDKIYKYDAGLLRALNADQTLCYLFERFGNVWSVWCHLFRMDFLREQNLWFDEELKRGEDIDWMIYSILSATRFDAFPERIHRYRVDSSGSIHKRRTFDMFAGGYRVSVKWFRYFQNQYSGRARDYLLRYLSEYYIHFCGYIPLLPREQRRKAMQMYQENADIGQYRSETEAQIPLVNFL